LRTETDSILFDWGLAVDLIQPRQILETPYLVGPLYLQVAEHVRSRVRLGEWPASKSLPNEGDLAAHYHVSLGTMRKALEHLVRQKMLVRLQGRGTFVKQNQSGTADAVRFLEQASENWAPASQELKVQVISQDHSTATTGEASLLLAAAGAPVERVSFVTKLRDVATSMDTLVCLKDFSSFDPNAEKLSMQELMNNIAYLIAPAVEYQDRVEPTLASAKVSKHLEVPVGTPVLSIDRVAVSETGAVPVVLRRHMFLQKRVKYSVVQEG
jgi:GntR family transcriptional regulator